MDFCFDAGVLKFKHSLDFDLNDENSLKYWSFILGMVWYISKYLTDVFFYIKAKFHNI